MNLVRVGIGFGAVAAGYFLKKGFDAKSLDIEIVNVTNKNNTITCAYKDSAGKMHAAYQHGNQWCDNSTEELLYDKMSDRLTTLCLAWLKTRQETKSSPLMLTTEKE
jgi:hypothetical protein